jgi:hypothetical protein
MLVAGAVHQVDCPTSTKPNIHAQDGPGCHLASQHRSSGPEQNDFDKHLPVTKEKIPIKFHFNCLKKSRRKDSCTAKTQFRKFETNIPREGIARAQSQFPHSYVCERFIYSHDRSAYPILLQENMETDPGNI